MLVLYIPLFAILLYYCVYLYFERKFSYWKNRKVVGPKPVYFFGNLKESILRRVHVSSIYTKIYNDFPNEKVVGIYRTITPCLLLRDLDVIKHVMIKDFDMFVDRGIEFQKKGLGTNLFHTDGEMWRALRSEFSPLFTSGKLKNMLHLMVERGDKFIDYVGSLVHNKTEQDVSNLVQKYTLSTITSCAFGVDLDLNSNQFIALENIDKLIFTLNYRNEIDMIYPGILKKLNVSLFPEELNAFFHNLIQTVTSQRNGKIGIRKDFIDLLLELREKGKIVGKKYEDIKQQTVEITDQIMAAQAFVFFAAGYETSATTMSFLLYQLALNPEIQDKLIFEIDETLKQHNGQITYDVLQELKYLHKVFKETLRMYPILDPLQRQAKVNYTIPGTDVEIKKGQLVFIPLEAIQHDKKYYPDPEKFDPERFSAENVMNRHACAYLPFGTGPRNCIGMRFAQTQSYVGMVKLLSKYRVTPAISTPKALNFDPMRILLTQKGGIRLNMIPR